MATITYRTFKFKSMIKKSIVTNRAFFTYITFGRIDSFSYINSTVIQHL